MERADSGPLSKLFTAKSGRLELIGAQLSRGRSLSGAAFGDEAQVRVQRLATHSFLGFKDIEDAAVEDRFELGAQLGAGAFGVVREAVDRSTKEKFCCKSIPRSSVTPEMMLDIRVEAQVMVHLRGHPNIVEIIGMYMDEEFIHIVEELCSGGDLYSKLTRTPMPYTEKEVAGIMCTVLQVLSHCHAMGVLYRDCKPENFLLSNDGPDAVLKAADFGISRFLKPNEKLEDFCGTPTYMAPEVFGCSYGFPSDVWSAGVMMYWLLCGDFPFKGRTKMDLGRKIAVQEPSIAGGVWDQITPDAKDCLMRMLCKDPSKRESATSLLGHKWFKAMSRTPAKPDNGVHIVLQRMRTFASMNPFKQEVLRVIARNYLEPAYMVGLRAMFDTLDVSKTGILSVQDIITSLQEQGTQVDAAEMKVLAPLINDDHHGAMDFLEFAACTIHNSLLEQSELLHKVFNFYDTRGAGFISREDIEEALHGANHEKERVELVLKQLDKRLQGKMTFEDFSLMLFECEDTGRSGFMLRWRVKKEEGVLSDNRRSLTSLPNLQLLTREQSPGRSHRVHGANSPRQRRSSLGGVGAANPEGVTVQLSERSFASGLSIFAGLAGRGPRRASMPQVSLPGGPHTATDAMGCETGKSNAQNLESRAHSGRAPVETSGLSGFFSRISMMGHRGHSSQGGCQSEVSASSHAPHLDSQPSCSSPRTGAEPSATTQACGSRACSASLGLHPQPSMADSVAGRESSHRPSCLRRSTQLSSVPSMGDGKQLQAAKSKSKHITWSMFGPSSPTAGGQDLIGVGAGVQHSCASLTEQGLAAAPSVSSALPQLAPDVSALHATQSSSAATSKSTVAVHVPSSPSSMLGLQTGPRGGGPALFRPSPKAMSVASSAHCLSSIGSGPRLQQASVTRMSECTTASALCQADMGHNASLQCACFPPLARLLQRPSSAVSQSG